MAGRNAAVPLESVSGEPALPRVFQLRLIVISALLVLHKRIWELCRDEGVCAHNNDTLKAIMAIKFAIRMVIDITRKFHMDLEFINLHALPPPATYCTYMAAMLHIQFAGQDFMSPEWKSDMECMRSTLRYFGKRWHIGGKSFNSGTIFSVS